MLAYAFRRGYFALIGVLLFTVPIFALLRFALAHVHRTCIATSCPAVDHWVTQHEGSAYLVWSYGQAPGDYWPIALALLAGGVAIQAFAMLRSNSR